MRVKFASTVAGTRAEVWDFVAHFQNINKARLGACCRGGAKWDPGVSASKKVSDGPTAVGTKLDLTTLFKGKESPMTYTVKEWLPPNRVVLTGEGDIVRATDIIEFADGPTPGTTRVEYNADISLKGVYGLFTWLVAGDIKGLAVKAKEGLESAFVTGAHKSPDKE